MTTNTNAVCPDPAAPQADIPLRAVGEAGPEIKPLRSAAEPNTLLDRAGSEDFELLKFSHVQLALENFHLDIGDLLLSHRDGRITDLQPGLARLEAEMRHKLGQFYDAEVAHAEALLGVRPLGRETIANLNDRATYYRDEANTLRRNALRLATRTESAAP